MNRPPTAAASHPDVSSAAADATVDGARAPRSSGGARVLLALAAFTALVVGASGVIALLVALARYVDRLV